MYIKNYLLLQTLLTTAAVGPIAGYGINIMQVPKDDPAQVICTMALLNKYFSSGEALSGAVLAMSITTASINIQQNLLQAIHAEKTLPWTVSIRNARKEAPTTSALLVLHEKPQCYFVVVENLEDEDLEDIFEDWKTTINWNPMAQFVVYLASVEETDEEMTELMIEILLNFMNKKIYNINVIGQNEENGFFYGKTVFPYHPDNNCGNRVIAIETLDICDYQEAEQEDNEEEEEEESEYVYDEGGEGVRDVGNEEHNATGEGEAKQEDDENDNGDDNDIDNDTKNKDGNNDQQVGQNNNSNNDTDNESRVKKVTINEVTEKEMNTNNKNFDDNVTSDAATSKDEEYVNKKKFRKVDQTQKKNVSKNSGKTIIQTKIKRKIKRQKRQADIATSSKEDAGDGATGTVYMEEHFRALFLDKFPKDLSGCPLVAAFRPWEPFIFSIESSNESQTVEYVQEPIMLASGEALQSDVFETDTNEVEADLKLSGIEYKMVQTIAERLHISIDLQVENRNLYQLFQQLIDGDIEMVVGGIDEDPSISQFVSSTIPYVQDDLTWCVAKAKRQHNLFNFLEGFQGSTWALMVTFVLATSLTIFVIQRALNVKMSQLRGYFTIAINMFGVVLTQSLQLKCIPSALKISLGTAFFMGLMFTNIYQSFLISTLTTPKSSYQISHLTEIYHHRMAIMGSVENVRHLNKDGEIFKYIREQFQMCYNIEECLMRAATDDRVAVAVSRKHSFYNPRIPRNDLYCFDRNENLYVYLVTMLLPKKYHLLHKINPVIQHVIESGHMEMWSRDLDMKRKIEEEMYRVRESSVRSLALTEIGGSFAFASFFLVIALAVFICECWVHHLVTQRRTRLKLVKLIHRHFS